MLLGPHIKKEMFRHIVEENSEGETAGDKHSILNHIKAAIKHGDDMDTIVGAAGIFVSGPRNHHLNITPDEAKDIHQFVNTFEGNYGRKFHLNAHGKYSDFMIWKEPTRYGILSNECRLCDACGIPDLVVHLPASPEETVHEAIKTMKRSWKVKLMLETPPVTPDKAFFNRPDQLQSLYSRLSPNIGLCVDSAHMWIGGSSFTGYDETMKWLELTRVALSKNRNPIMFHLNDSKRPFGTGPDEHETLAEGFIWNKIKNMEESGIYAIMDFAQKYECPIILERATLGGIESDYVLLAKYLEKPLQ